jgi:hypothetical protein
MSRKLKLVLYVAIAWMTLVALAVFAWRHGVFPGLPQPTPATRGRFMVVFLPPWLAVVAIYLGRRLSSDRPRISDSHRRYIERGLPAAAAIFVAMQGLYAYVDVTGAKVDAVLLGRGVIAVSGLWLMIQGNAAAKLDPPSGDGAPPPGVWTRMLLRWGWIMVGMGVATVVSAFALPLPLPRPLALPVMTAFLAILVGGELAYRRMTRPGGRA